LVKGAITSVVEVTSVNSRGLAGPTLIRAVSLPSVAAPQSEFVGFHRAAPHAGLGGVEGERAGGAGGARHRHLGDAVLHGLALHGDVTSAHEQAQASSSRSGCFISQ